MEKTIITFQADEQNLVKTSGVECYASDTVSYVQAVFTLGTNWIGFDSVRAMWRFGSTVIATVLDSNGTCLVPHEVLTKRGELKVNLVGSIAEGNVLTDRLTTFPIIALIITKIAEVEGDETAEVTPSQFEQYVALTNAGASRAEASAEQAEAFAQASEQSAQASSQSAQSASESAESASQSAESASQSAESASQSAEEAEQASQSVLGLTATASVDSSVGTPSVEVTVETVGDHKVMDFDFHNLKGEQGEQGVQGEKGEQGERGETGQSGADGFSPTVEVTPTTDGNEVTITDVQGEHTFEVKNGTVEDIYPFLPTDTAQGEIASFSDGANDVPVTDLTIQIDPIQSGSGDPSPDNIRPISGWTGAVVQRTGINVWDEEWENGRFNINTGLKSFGNGLRSKSKISVVPNAKYYLTRGNYTGASSFLILYYDANENFISYENKYGTTATITIPSNAHFINLNLQTSKAVTTYNNDISINYPSTDTSYHAYQGQTHSISWATEAGTVYGGTLDVTTGLLTVDRAMVDMGTLTWYLRVGLFVTNIDASVLKGTLISSQYKQSRVASFGSLEDMSVWNESYAYYPKNVVVKDTRYTDVATFTTAMNGVQLVYELATPQTFQLSATEIRTLQGDNNIWADTGDTEVTYRADIQKYIDKQISAVLNA